MRIFSKFIKRKDQNSCGRIRSALFVCNQKGVVFIEVIVAIAVIVVILVIYSASLRSLALNKKTRLMNLATSLISEELEAIRTIPFASLTNRIDAPFVGIAYNKGNFKVKKDTGTSPPNVLNLSSSTNPTEPQIALLPGGSYDDFTYEVKANVLSDSPTGWRVGVYFRYKDSQNYYSLYFSQDKIIMNKVIDGIPTSLYSSSQTFSTNTWYTLKIVTNEDTLTPYLNDNPLTTAITDYAFSYGSLALLGSNSVHAHFDDITLTTGSTTTWNFDADTVGDVPQGWERFSLYDLPGGEGKLTIENYHDGIKKVQIEVIWEEEGKEKSVKFTTLVSEYGLNY